MVPKWRLFNVDATWWRRIDGNTTSFYVMCPLGIFLLMPRSVDVGVHLFRQFCLKDKKSVLYRIQSQSLLVLWPCYLVTYVRWSISLEQMWVSLDCCITWLCHPMSLYLITPDTCLGDICKECSLRRLFRVKTVCLKEIICKLWQKWTHSPEIPKTKNGLIVFNRWVSFAPEFQCCYFCESSCLFYPSFNFDFYVSKIMHLWVRNLPRKPNN